MTLEELEQVSGQQRWTLSRDLRALFGTSPYRYLTLRRLDLVRQRIATGANLSGAAFLAGFADHLALTWVTVDLAAMSTYASVGSTVSRWFGTPRRVRVFNRTTGGLFVAAGGALATSHR
ncbi:helix-turn-helix domain-containing protein [Kushneria aurantia]|uniref:Helix-turn-helix domain-containing protein n=1 Tax=Kushneria aurantia TaxID=504092 RepID=A0ABV6G393_9GAMM|nr:helix-turn-helix domain-containing protein [Kushneria aurantia]